MSMAMSSPASHMRPYQTEGIEWLKKHPRGILADEQGLGKTPQALIAGYELGLWMPGNTTLVVGPKSAIGVWQDEIPKWLGPDVPVHTYQGKPAERTAALRALVNFNRGGFLLTNYSMVRELSTRHNVFDTIILDECHITRNRKTKTFDALQKFDAKILWCLTGTPIVNGAPDLWTVLNLLRPDVFSSFWKFVEKYCYVYKDGYGWEIGKVKDAPALRRLLTLCLLRRRKQDVLLDLPPKQRQKIRYQLTDAQRSLYDEVATEILTHVKDDFGDTSLLKVPGSLALITRLRQICVTPALVGGSTESAAIEALVEKAETDFDDKRNIAVFSPFANALPVIAHQLESRLKANTWIVHGQMSQQASREAVREFQASPLKRKALLCTIKSATSFTATEASSAYFIGAEWTPAANWQAEDRVHRFGSTKAVDIYYLQADNTVEEDLVYAILNDKAEVATAVLRPQKQPALLA